MSKTKAKIAIIGAGQAGLQTAQSLRQEGHEGPIYLIGEEPYAPYQRPPLSKAYLAGDLASDRLELKPGKFYADNDITCLFGAMVSELDVAGRRLIFADGKVCEFGMALLATGSRARALPISGSDLEGVFALRTIGDVDLLRSELVAGRRLVIIGGGYIGLEVAAVARGLGLEVTVFEALDRVMARSTSERISRHYEAMHRAHGVKVELGVGVERIERTTAGLAIHHAAGIQEADFVLAGIGGQANQELAEAAGLPVANGIVVDEW